MKQRLLTAIIGIIVVVPLIIYGSWPFFLITYFLATIALFELVRMYPFKKTSPYLGISFLFLWLLLYPIESLIVSNFVMSIFDITILFAAILLVFTVLSKNKFTFDHAAFILFASLYIGIAFYYLLVTRFEGLNYFLFILFIVGATDTGAYFIGKFFGKRKLWPEISPNKTIGGAVGGVIFGLIVTIVFQWIYPFDKTFFQIFIISIVLAIVGKPCDLVVCATKRHYQVKASGRTFPGYCCTFACLDSLLFVLPILHFAQFF